MFAIAFDLVVAVTEATHPKGYRQAYLDIEVALRKHGFNRVQHSLYVSEEQDFVGLVAAMNALKALPWFGTAVKDVRAFKMEHWSDFTPWAKS